MVEQEPSRRASVDVRQTGFFDRASLEKALGWIDARALRLGPEAIRSDTAVSRVLSAPIAAAADLPPLDRAAEDGFAVRSSETIGAGSYSPLSFELQPAGAPVRLGAVTPVAAGNPLPGGADAVLPFGMARLDGATVEVIGAVAQGAGVERKAQHLRAGTSLFGAGRVLRPQDAGLLASLGEESVLAVRRPKIRLVLAGPKGRAAADLSGDAHRPMLLALIGRDGGVVEGVVPAASGRASIRSAIERPGADAILVTGRTGTGPDDDAPLALADVGELAIHGVALRPGAAAGLGAVGAAPVILLPGDPFGCLCAYELFAGRLIRRLGGRNPDLPHPVRETEIARKIVSAIGFVEMCLVRLVNGKAEPVGWAEGGGLASAALADGFVLVPAALEGYAPGARVEVRLFEPTLAP
jgi:molybdopterin molybdotransferase